MTDTSKNVCGIILLTVPSIQYGGYFLLKVLSGNLKLPLTDFQRAMFRAGHAHAGVLVILSIIAEILIDNTGLNSTLEWIARMGFPLAAILVSGGFFAGASGKNVVKPNGLIAILYIGALLLAFVLVLTGISLIRSGNS